jgi:Zn-dependent M28 family amino/carboxypeptidase
MRMSGNHRITWENRPTRPEIFVMNSQFAKLVSAVKGGQEVQLTFDMRNEFKKGPIKLYNVVAEIPGTEKPDECVIVGGHIDSWDLASGATDNATGVATTMEAARILCAVGAKPKRTIRFILWSGEEQGLLGSIGWVRKHKTELPKISAVFVHDWGTNYISGLAATPALMPHLEKVFAPVMDLDPQMKFTLRQTATIPRAPSDNMPYLSAQVPAFFWSQSGRANYTYGHHTQHDHFDRIIPEYQKHSAIVVALAAWGVANLETLLPR